MDLLPVDFIPLLHFYNQKAGVDQQPQQQQIYYMPVRPRVTMLMLMLLNLINKHCVTALCLCDIEMAISNKAY